MRIEDTNFDSLQILDRLSTVYGFHQKIQLANHFDMSASSLSNRYTRGNVSYDLVALCALETGASIRWLLTGEGPRFANDATNNGIEVEQGIPYYTLLDGEIHQTGSLPFPPFLHGKVLTDPICITIDNQTYFIERAAPLSDGMWLINIEGAVSIRDLTVLPGKKLHVAGGKVPFECGFDEITKLGKVIGKYSEVV